VENRSFVGDAYRVSIVIAVIHTVWIAISLLLQAAGNCLPTDIFSYRGLVGSVVFFHICLAALATAFFMVYAMEPLRGRHRLRIEFIGFCIFLTLAIFICSRQLNPEAHLMLRVLKTINTANLIVFANLLGSWITIALKRQAELVPVSVVVVLADLFSVFKGPSREIIENLTVYYEAGMAGSPPVFDFLVLKIAVPGMMQLVPAFGVSDWIIIAFFSAAAVKFGFNDNLAGKGINEMLSRRRPAFYFPVSAIGLFVAVQAAQALDIFLPAIPLVVIFFMSYTVMQYPDTRRLKRSDWLATGGAVLIMSVLMVVYCGLF
jgi:hypothetical protein